MARRKSNNNFMADEPREGWAFFEQTNTWRRTPSPSGASPEYFPKEWGDWVAVSRPKDWLPDENTRLNLGSSLHAAPGASEAPTGSGGGGMKIGAGHKPQPYGWHGYYGETGGGISGGHEVRGKVTPSAKAGKTSPVEQATKPTPRGKVTWNSPLKPAPSEQQLEPNMSDALHTVGEGKDLNVSSAYRPADAKEAVALAQGKPVGLHCEGNAVDVNYVNGAHISEVANKGGAADAELRRQIEEMQARAEKDPNVQAFISPYGGFFRSPSDPTQITQLPPTNTDVQAHWNHVHIGVFRKK